MIYIMNELKCCCFRRTWWVFSPKICQSV